MFHGHLGYFQKSPLEGRFNTKWGDHGTPNAHNCWFILFYNVWRPAWIEIHRNSICMSTRSHVTSHYAWGPWTHYMILEVCWDNLWTLSFNFMVTALGSCVKWPLVLGVCYLPPRELYKRERIKELVIAPHTHFQPASRWKYVFFAQIIKRNMWDKMPIMKVHMEEKMGVRRTHFPDVLHVKNTWRTQIQFVHKRGLKWDDFIVAM